MISATTLAIISSYIMVLGNKKIAQPYSKVSYHPKFSLGSRFSFHSVSLQLSCSVMFSSLQSHGLCSPPDSSVHGDSPGKNTEVGCHGLLLPSLFPSIRVFPNKSVLCIRWPKYGSFSFIISPSNEYSGLISFRMDWLDLLAI